MAVGCGLFVASVSRCVLFGCKVIVFVSSASRYGLGMRGCCDDSCMTRNLCSGLAESARLLFVVKLLFSLSCCSVSVETGSARVVCCGKNFLMSSILLAVLRFLGLVLN